MTCFISLPEYSSGPAQMSPQNALKIVRVKANFFIVLGLYTEMEGRSISRNNFIRISFYSIFRISFRLFPAVRFHKVQDRTERHDARGIYLAVRHIVMALDVVEIDRLSDARLLIKIHQITLQVRIIDDAPEIAFEMPVVDDVEADERAKHSPIGFDDAVGKEIP